MFAQHITGPAFVPAVDEQEWRCSAGHDADAAQFVERSQARRLSRFNDAICGLQAKAWYAQQIGAMCVN